MPASSPRSGLAAVGAGAVLWGTTGVAVRIIAERTSLPAISIGCYRLAVAAVVLAAVLGRTGPGRLRAVWRRRPVALLVSGVGLGWYQALYFVGVQNVGVSVSTLISLAVAPVALTLAAAVRARRVPGPAALAPLVGAVGGLTLISLTSVSGAPAPHPLLGILASLGSGLGYAATTAVNRHLTEAGDPVLLTGATSAIGALALLPVAAVAGLGLPGDAVAGGWLIYIGIVPTVIAYALFYGGLRTVPAEIAGVLTLLEPLTATLLAAAVVHEHLAPLGWAGAALLLAAIAGLYVRPRVPDAPPL